MLEGSLMNRSASIRFSLAYKKRLRLLVTGSILSCTLFLPPYSFNRVIAHLLFKVIATVGFCAACVHRSLSLSLLVFSFGCNSNS